MINKSDLIKCTSALLFCRLIHQIWTLVGKVTNVIILESILIIFVQQHSACTLPLSVKTHLDIQYNKNFFKKDERCPDKYFF